jgi:hypothetical protein
VRFILSLSVLIDIKQTQHDVLRRCDPGGIKLAVHLLIPIPWRRAFAPRRIPDPSAFKQAKRKRP